MDAQEHTIARDSQAARLKAIQQYILVLHYEPLATFLQPEDYLRLSDAVSEEMFWELRHEMINGIKWLIVLDPLTDEPLAIHPRVGYQVTFGQRAPDIAPLHWQALPAARVIGGHIYPYGSVAKALLEKQRERDKERKKHGAVYFAQAEEGWPIKIGFSTNPAKRLRALQSAHGQLIKIIGLIDGVTVKREREIHKQFKEDRLRGEWFRPSAALLAFLVQYRHNGPIPEWRNNE